MLDHDRFSHPQYEVRQTLAHGRVTVIYEAESKLASHRRVALKVLRDVAFADWFLRVARTTGSLEHPGIVACHEVGEVHGVRYMMLDFMAGGSLHDSIKPWKNWSAEATICLSNEVAAALTYAHGMGLVHGYVHPKHILFDEEGHARLIGFGEQPLPEIAMMGNPIHLAPEQFDRSPLLTPRTDVYALAQTLSWTLTGRHPFPEHSSMGLLAMKRWALPATFLRNRPELPAALRSVLCRAMAPAPHERFGSVSEFAEAFAASARPKVRRRWWNFWRQG